MKYIFAILLLTGCASEQHRRDALQAEHPDCFVMHDLTIECPNPFADTSAGFGAEVTNQKIKKKVKRRGK
jgi:hypothetical protein